MYKIHIKSITDFCISLLLLIVASPILILITLLLFFSNKGKPFFFQLRPGKNDKIFKWNIIYELCAMVL